jgi:hypothetical protein
MSPRGSAPTPIVSVPADALIFNQKGMQVAVVRSDATVKMRKIEIARDLGTTVDVKSGLEGGEKLVMSAPPALVDGSKIKVADGDSPRERCLGRAERRHSNAVGQVASGSRSRTGATGSA